MGGRNFMVVGAVLLVTSSARADTFSQVGRTQQGRIRYVMTGASMVDNQGLQNGVNCLKSSATAPIQAADLPPRASLVSATLYISGSLIGDDGPDYVSPALDIFTTVGLRADNPAQLAAVEAAARAAADTAVDFTPPGAAAPVTVSTTPDAAYVTVYYKVGGGETGNVGFFVTPIDVTEAILSQGQGVLAGTYTVSGLLADVCLGEEAVCVNPPGPPTCGSVSATHTNGAASFALLLLVEDPELPLHSVTVFDGLKALSGNALALNLQLANPISSPAVGSLTFYALEGDLLIPNSVVNVGPCHAEEYIEVNGHGSPPQPGLCLSDDDNPVGNLFNSTINVLPAAGANPVCGGPIIDCCQGDGLCGVTGVDIDRFDISSALTSGATSIDVNVGTGGDRIALAAVVVGVDVFEPFLTDDTQIRVFEQTGQSLRQVEDGLVQLGSTIEYSIAVSNTGNVDAHGVSVHMSAPATTSGIALVSMPPLAGDQISQDGGAYGAGDITVWGFDVPAGEIAEVRVEMLTECAGGPHQLGAQAEVSSWEIAQFPVLAPTLEVAGPGVGACAGIDTQGPFAPPPVARNLRGGAGCSATGTDASLLAVVVGLFLLFLGTGGRKARALILAALVLPFAHLGCGKRHQAVAVPPPPPKDITSLTGVPGEPCGNDVRVWITRADGSRFCIDRFEAGYSAESLGDAQQSVDDTDSSTNGSTLAHATVDLGVTPATGVSWYQARALCENAGKKLCARADWERACRGPQSLIYPYGDQIDDHACNGFFNYPPEKPAPTGSLKTCGSAFGVFDLSGNVEEWTFDAVPRVPGTVPLNDRAIRGGSFKSNSHALACFGDEFHAAPGTSDMDRGFRCCSDGPV